MKKIFLFGIFLLFIMLSCGSSLKTVYLFNRQTMLLDKHIGYATFVKCGEKDGSWKRCAVCNSEQTPKCKEIFYDNALYDLYIEDVE
ncbi:hypothetical protein M0R19_03285 [Candidatus Pacearchaeota archaeon]|jgi:antirestriction protein|nr:hypothetical protein [Candidatus Pacearchaeota archaeon]